MSVAVNAFEHDAIGKTVCSDTTSGFPFARTPNPLR
jgi:hypothetical protein